MTTTLRIDDVLKRQCDSILGEMGLNLSCAITIFLKELTRRRAMPFAIRATGAIEMADDEVAGGRSTSSLRDRYLVKCQGNGIGMAEQGRRARALFAEMRAGSGREWTLEEINAEIAASRAERHACER